MIEYWSIQDIKQKFLIRKIVKGMYACNSSIIPNQVNYFRITGISMTDVYGWMKFTVNKITYEQKGIVGHCKIKTPIEKFLRNLESGNFWKVDE